MTVAALLHNAEADREAWKYTSLKPLRALDFKIAAVPTVDAAALPPLLEPQGQRLVFINGHYRAALSATQALPGDLFDGIDGDYRLDVHDATCLATQPLELLFVTVPGGTPQESLATLALSLGSHARLTLLERHITLGEGAPVAAQVALNVALGEQAKLLQLKFQEQTATDYHFGQLDAQLGRGAFFDQFCLTTGAALSRNNINVALNGPEAQTRLHGAYLLRGTQHGDTTTIINHNAPQTTSAEHYRGVLDGKARGVFQGKIVVAQAAQQSDGQQMSRALLLSDTAEANSKPELEIYADNVKCSHGATVGQLDESALFYLQSRGIPQQQARALLVSAFVTEVTDGIGSEAGREAALQRVERWYGDRP